MKRIDCSGMTCPKPVIMAKKELESIESGEIDIIVDNETARENVAKLAKSMGLQYEVSSDEGLYHVIIKKEAPDACNLMKFNENRRPVILVGSDKFGTGDDNLGAALMKSYLYALTESEIKPSSMLFVNGGVKLTTEGSGVLESIKTLENQGVEILSCGTCLDFYGLKEKLVVGAVTNMYTIVEKTNSSPNTIKL